MLTTTATCWFRPSEGQISEANRCVWLCLCHYCHCLASKTIPELNRGLILRNHELYTGKFSVLIFVIESEIFCSWKNLACFCYLMFATLAHDLIIRRRNLCNRLQSQISYVSFEIYLIFFFLQGSLENDERNCSVKRDSS